MMLALSASLHARTALDRDVETEEIAVDVVQFLHACLDVSASSYTIISPSPSSVPAILHSAPAKFRIASRGSSMPQAWLNASFSATILKGTPQDQTAMPARKAATAPNRASSGRRGPERQARRRRPRGRQCAGLGFAGPARPELIGKSVPNGSWFPGHCIGSGADHRD